MYENFRFKDVNQALPSLLTRLDTADEVGSRVGRTKEITHVGITLEEPHHREILLPARKPNLAAQIAETMWVLAGRDDMDFLLNYLPRAADFSDDGKTWRAGYGARLRRWKCYEQTRPLDQIRWVYEHLKKDPASRRAVLSIWDPIQDTADGVKDIPCNDWLNFSSRLGRLDLHVAVRSNDVIWGWSGINQFEWSALLEVMAGLLGLKTGSLHFSTTSFHIYDRHWNKAAKIVEHAPSSGADGWGLEDSPRFEVGEGAGNFASPFDWFEQCMEDWFAIEEQIRAGNPCEGDVDGFPEPMLRSWLRVLQWWWSGEKEYLAPLEGTRLERATLYSVQPKAALLMAEAVQVATTLIKSDLADKVRAALKPFGVERVTLLAAGDIQAFLDLALENTEEIMADGKVVRYVVSGSPFIRHAIALHNEKHLAYGDSWKKRGESFSIIPNIARKVDRLGGSETQDETSADTALDLMVYLAKYKVWLEAHASGEPHDLDVSDFPDAANAVLLMMERVDMGGWVDNDGLVKNLKNRFDDLLVAVESGRHDKEKIVVLMLQEAYGLALRLWESEQDEYRGADVD